MQLRQVTTGIAAGAACLAVGLSAPLAAAHDSVIGGNVVSDAPLEEFLAKSRWNSLASQRTTSTPSP